jgi:hypothetical protein
MIQRSPDGAQRNPGTNVTPAPDFASGRRFAPTTNFIRATPAADIRQIRIGKTPEKSISNQYPLNSSN